MNESRAASRVLRFATPPGLFALAVAVRILPWREVLSDGRILPVSNDAYYHLRRIAYSAYHFPSVLEYDAYINFPLGAKPIWSPLFDWTVAWVLRPFLRPLGEGGLGDLEVFAMWVPPLLGAATVLAAYFLTRRFFGYGAGLATGLGLCLLSGHFWYSQIGFLDHHAAVALVTTGLLAACMGLLAADERELLGRARIQAVLVGAAIALALLVWPGSLIHVAIAEVAFVAHLLLRPERQAAKRFAGRLALAHCTAFAAVAPFTFGSRWPQWGDFSPVVLSNFQPWMLGGIALGTALCAGLWSRSRLGSDRRQRALGFAGVGMLVLGVSFALVPGLLGGGEVAWAWLTKQEEFQALVSESMPLLRSGETLSPRVAFVRLSWFFALFPFALVVLARSFRTSPERSALWMLLWWSAALFALTLLQRRFFNSSSVCLAVVMGACAARVFVRLAPDGCAAMRRFGAATAVAAGLAVLLAPTVLPYGRYLSNELAARRGARLVVTSTFSAKGAAVATAAWLSDATPPTAGWIDPARRPRYGVLAPWSLGHLIEYVGRRPTIVDNFGDDLGKESFRWARDYWFATEPEALAGLNARRVRYVISQRGHHFLGEKPGVGTLFHSLYYLDGSQLVPPADAPEVPTVAALERHRLVFESHGVDLKDPDAPAAYKVYELVRGVRVIGRAAPGSTIDVSISLKTNRNRVFKYETLSRANAAGRYEVRLPYSNREGPQAVRPTKRYRFTCGAESRYLSVAERDVQQGRSLRGPALCAQRS